MRVNKKAILDTIEWAKTALSEGMRVPPVPTSQVTEDILFKRAVVVALWAFWKPEQFQRQQQAGRWKAETPTITKVLSLLQTIDGVPVLDVQVDNDGMLHVKLIGGDVDHIEEDADDDGDPDALWYTFLYAVFTPEMVAKVTGNREKKFDTWGTIPAIGGPHFGLGVLKTKTSCVTIRKDGAVKPVFGAVVALTNDELDSLLKVALRETGVPYTVATLSVGAKGVRGPQQMYVPVPAPGGVPNGGTGGTRDFEANDVAAAANVLKTVDKLLALPTQADAYLQLLKPQQQNAQTGFIGGLRDFDSHLMNVTGKAALALLGTVPILTAVKFGYFGSFGHGPFRAIRTVNEEVKNLKGAAATQASTVTASVEMLAAEYNALSATLPTHGGRTPAAAKDVLDSVGDFVTKGILSCADEQERKQRTKETAGWLVTWGDKLAKNSIAHNKVAAFTEAVVKLLANVDSTLKALGYGAVFGVGAYAPATAEEVPAPKEPSFRMSPAAWESWKPKSNAQRALLGYLNMLYTATDPKTRPIFDAIIDRLHTALGIGGNSTGFTFSQIGAIIQRADMDSVTGSNVATTALDFLLADVVGYAENLYQSLKAKGGAVTDNELLGAMDMVRKLMPNKMFSVSKMTELGEQLGDVHSRLERVLDTAAALRGLQSRANGAEEVPAPTAPSGNGVTEVGANDEYRGATPAVTGVYDWSKEEQEPAAEALRAYCMYLFDYERIAHKMARGGKALLMQEVDQLRVDADLFNISPKDGFDPILSAVMQQAHAYPRAANDFLEGIARRSFDSIIRITYAWEKLLPTMAENERAYNVREMKVLRYLLSIWDTQLESLGDLDGIAEATASALKASRDYLAEVDEAIINEKSTGRFSLDS